MRGAKQSKTASVRNARRIEERSREEDPITEDKLKNYTEERDLDSSDEPDGGDVDFDWAEHPVFVIQKHDATSLHYDFRLEVDGVLKSWAVPKGPSTDPSEKRLALPTEDHPLEYANFEGVIPEDEYGGGTVIIWDRGSYENAKEPDENDERPPVAQQLDDGHATIRLKGEKIRGGYALIKTSTGEDEKWLLVKMDDDEADARRNPESTETKSVESGKTIEEVSEEKDGDK